MKLTKAYVPALDGMRGVAILLVIISHYGFGNYVPGGFGVSLFFYISGLLITRLLIIEQQETGGINLKQFYLRRLFRLYPALVFFTAVATIYMLIYGYHYLRIGEIIATLFYYRNYYPHIFNLPDPPKEYGVFRIVWSLSIEEHFYIVFPFLFMLMYKRIKLFISVTGLLIVLALLWRLYVIHTHGGIMTVELSDRIHYLSDTRFDAMLYGCLSSLLLSLDWGSKLVRFIGNRITFIFGLVLVVLSIYVRSEAFRESYRYTVQGIAFFILVPAILHNSSYQKVQKMLSAPWLTKVGKLSYSLYLCHWIGVAVAYYYHAYDRANFTWIITAAPIGIVLTYICYNFVELPTAKWRKKYGSNVNVPEKKTVESGSMSMALAGK